MDKIRVGISSCLLGEKVRYDGQHKFDHFLAVTLGEFIEYVPVCPEVECGLSVPREAMRLVGDASDPRLVAINSKKDLTDQLKVWGEKRIRSLESEQLCGFIFKAKSPSSGMERIKVYPEAGGAPQRNGRGIFAAMFMNKFPFLPVEDDGRLHDPEIRENFIERLFVYRRWIDLTDNGCTVSGLLQFHAGHKLLLMAHSPEHYRAAGKIAASAAKSNIRDVIPLYLKNLMEGLKKTATVKKNYNVLLHIFGYFKKDLIHEEKIETIRVLDDYKSGFIPLIAPVTLLNHFTNRFDRKYLKEQWYLHPHPVELKLRNHS